MDISTNRNKLRNRIIETALSQESKPYIYDKHGSDAFDCAGFVWYISRSTWNRFV